jgi:hypothetical protein
MAKNTKQTNKQTNKQNNYAGKVLERIFKWPLTSPYFCDYFPFKEYFALYLKNIEFLQLRMIWPSLNEMVGWFLRKCFSKIFIVFDCFANIFLVLSFSLPKDHLCKVWLKLILVKSKM